MSSEQVRKVYVLTWGWYDGVSDKTSVVYTFVFDNRSTAIEGIREDLKAKFLAMINFFVTSEENRNIPNEKLCEVYSLLENHFNMIQTITTVNKANEIVNSIADSLDEMETENLGSSAPNQNLLRLYAFLMDFIQLYEQTTDETYTGQYSIEEKIVDEISVSQDEKHILGWFEQFKNRLF